MTIRLRASQVSSALGLNPRQSRLALFLLLAGKMPPPEEVEGEDAAGGRLFEEPVAQEACKRHGMRIFDGMPKDESGTPLPLVSQSAPLLGHPDRYVVDSDGKLAVLEVKNPFHLTAETVEEWGPEGSDRVPTAHYMQTATYGALLSEMFADESVGQTLMRQRLAPCTYLAAWLPRIGLRLYRIPRDAGIEASIRSNVAAFVQRVEKDDPPDPIDDGDYGVRWMASRGKTHELSDENVADLLNRAKLGAEMAKADAEYRRLGNNIRAAMGDADTGTYKGRVLVKWASGRVFDPTLVAPDLLLAYSTKLDKAGLKKEHPKLYEAAMREPRSLEEQSRKLIETKALLAMLEQEKAAP